LIKFHHLNPTCKQSQMGEHIELNCMPSLLLTKIVPLETSHLSMGSL
jgi:hypothetical protein